MPEEPERWKNRTVGTAFVLKYDRYHNIGSEIVGPGREVTLSKEEREINQERAASSDLDIFANGIMIPMKIIDPDDQKAFAENPHLLSDSELPELLKLSRKAFEVRLKAMTNLYPLLRLKEMTQQEDTKVTVGVVQALDERIKQLTPDSPRMKSFADERE